MRDDELPETDAPRFELLRAELNSAVIGDILDQLGLLRQFLPTGIRGLLPEMVVVGRAMPVRIAPLPATPTAPFGRLTEALDQLRPGEVYLADGGGTDAAAWGELLTATAQSRGAVGAVLDAFHRDTRKVLEQGWPVFSRGAFAQDARARTVVADVRVPIRIGQVDVAPGDLVFGDVDGVVIVPSHVERDVLELALAKVRVENEVRRAIDAGMSSTAAFEYYGVL